MCCEALATKARELGLQARGAETVIRATAHDRTVDPILDSFVEAIDDDDPVTAAVTLRRFGEGKGASDYPREWLSKTGCST